MNNEMKPFSFEGSKILIVDDYVENLKVLGSYLLQKGIQVTPATKGNQAILLAQSKPFDLILLDIQMPEMDGYEVCKILKSDDRTKDIPVIFLSARNDTQDIVKGFNVGAVDYITKPFNSDEILSRIKNHLELKFAQDIINEQNTKLTQLNATKDKFFSIIAHDLKNPISSFRDTTAYLSDNYNEISEEEKIELIQLTRQSAEVVFSLLNDLLDWSRSQRGVIQYYQVETDLFMLAENVISILKPNALKKNITLENNIPPNTLASIDVYMILTVMRNLLTNAIKFTSFEGKCSFNSELLPDGNLIKVSLVDTGIGIPPEKIENLFKIDKSFTTPGTNNELGTGLGLILCKEFVEKNGGNIWVESEIGVGSKFIFTVPVANSQQE